MDFSSEDQLNITSWLLFRVAESLTIAKRLEGNRQDFHRELYEAISCRTTVFDKLDTSSWIDTSTDSQAIRIIEHKERYDREIQKEYDRDVMWRSFLALAEEKDRLIMIRYFKKKKYVNPEIISALLSRINTQVEEEEARIEKERNLQAQQDYMKHWKPNEQKKNIVSYEYIFSNSSSKWIEVDVKENARREWEMKSNARQLELRNQLEREERIYS